MVMRPRERGRTSHYNLYRYCHNDPVNRSDPFGLFSNDWVWDRLRLWQGGGVGNVGEQFVELRAKGALDEWAGWAKRHKLEVAGTITKNGALLVGPEKGRYPTKSDPGTITADTTAIWHLHLMLPKTAPYQFSTGPFGSYGGDQQWLHDYPHLSHFVGVLNAPPGQFHIFAQTPPKPYPHWIRKGPFPFPMEPMD